MPVLQEVRDRNEEAEFLFSYPDSLLGMSSSFLLLLQVIIYSFNSEDKYFSAFLIRQRKLKDKNIKMFEKYFKKINMGFLNEKCNQKGLKIFFKSSIMLRKLSFFFITLCLITQVYSSEIQTENLVVNIQVIDRFGKPVLSSVEPYAKVMIYDYEWRLIGEVILDEKGQSSVLLSPGIYNFEVRLYANEDRGIVAHCEGCYRTMITESKTVVFELKEYPTVLKIHVITLKGIPVKDVKVVLKFPVGYENDDAYTVLEKVTDSNGDAVFDKLLKGFWFFEKYNCINASIELSYMGETVRFFHPEFTTPIDNLTVFLDSFDKNLTISIGLFGWKEEYLGYL
ncbi:MAG: hypothetical protein QW532_07160, partial [Archaeoglobaceae archaeon]